MLLGDLLNKADMSLLCLRLPPREDLYQPPMFDLPLLNLLLDFV